MALPTKDLRQVYHVACTLGEVTNGYLETRLSKLCTSEKINQFSKWKPIHYKGNTLTEQILQSCNYGIAVTKDRNISNLIQQINNNGTHKYNRPFGGVNSPYRLGDFRGYDPSAKLPAYPLGDAEIKNGGNAVYSINNHSIINPGTATAMGQTDLYPSALHRGIYMINSRGDSAWCTDEIRWADIPNKPYWVGQVTCYDFFTNRVKAINESFSSNQNDMFYAVTSDALHPNPYRWNLTGQRPPDSDKYTFYALGEQTTDMSTIKFTVTMSAKDDTYAGGTATNIYVSVTTDKKGEDSCGMNNLVSASYTIRKGEEKIWTGTIQVPQAFRNKVLYIHVFADGYHFFNGQVIPEFPGRE